MELDSSEIDVDTHLQKKVEKMDLFSDWTF